MSAVTLKMACWVLVLSAAAALILGCGEAGEDPEVNGNALASTEDRSRSKELRVTLDGSESFQNVGLLMAVQRGFFKDVGLDVWVGSPLEPNRPVSYVAKGTDDFGVAQMPQVVIGKEKGLPIVAVGSVISRPTAAMIWLRGSGIGGIADLEGRTIAVPGPPFQKSFLEMILARAGLTLEDVKVRSVGYELVPALVTGQADAIFGGSWNIEGIELESLREKPVITRVQDLGIPDYEELVMIANSDLVAEDPQLIRDFMTAVARGTAVAMEDPQGALKAVRVALESVPPPNRKMMEAQARATLPLLSRSGYMSPGRAEGMVNWMYDEELIERQWPSGELLSNDYLPSP